MDPITITTLVITICGLALNIIQSVKMNHFQSECWGNDSCFSVTNHFEGKDGEKETTK